MDDFSLDGARVTLPASCEASPGARARLDLDAEADEPLRIWARILRAEPHSDARAQSLALRFDGGQDEARRELANALLRWHQRRAAPFSR